MHYIIGEFPFNKALEAISIHKELRETPVCPGSKGDMGPPGSQGIQGEQGPEGLRGPKGDIGTEGPTGPACPTSENAIVGANVSGVSNSICVLYDSNKFTIFPESKALADPYLQGPTVPNRTIRTGRVEGLEIKVKKRLCYCCSRL